jgi:hypothetical protein
VEHILVERCEILENLIELIRSLCDHLHEEDIEVEEGLNSNPLIIQQQILDAHVVFLVLCHSLSLQVVHLFTFHLQIFAMKEEI